MAIPQAIPDWTLQQYMTGSPGQSPALQSGVDAFNMAQMPVIQNQMQLAGLGQSPAVAQAASMGLSQALTPLIQSAMSNQLQAVQLNQRPDRPGPVGGEPCREHLQPGL